MWLVRFDPSVGAEIQKLRPAVVMNVAGLGRLPLVIVVPITEWKPHYVGFPWFVNLPATGANGLRKESSADAFQVKSVSETRLDRRLGILTDAQVDAIAAAIALLVGYNPPTA